MTIQKWIQQHKKGIIIGGLIALLIPLELSSTFKIISGAIIGGMLENSSTKSRGKNYGYFQFLANPWVIGGLLTLGATILTFFKKQPPTLSEQISTLPIWIWFVGGFFLLLIIKALRKKPRTIIIQEQR